MRYAITVLTAFLPLIVCSQDTIRIFTLGDATVRLVAHRTDKPGPLYFNMHDDEHTSVEAAAAVLGGSGGTLFELSHTGERFIGFYLDSTRYAVDPNRIYTNAGVWREMRRAFDQDSVKAAAALHSMHVKWTEIAVKLWSKESKAISKTVKMRLIQTLDKWRIPEEIPPFRFTAKDTMAFEIVRTFAQALISIMEIDTRPLVIALHNNKEDGYSASSYRVDSIYEKEALAIYMGWHADADDFYFVTDRRIFEALQPAYYHIVLQDNARMTDDGSLSVYCGQRGIPYVNVEAQHGHLFDQHSMLHFLLDRLWR
jgi:hypothetical protein